MNLVPFISTKESRHVTVTKLLALSLVPVLWVFLRSWNEFMGYSLPYLLGGVLVNTVAEAVALYVLITVCGLPRTVYLTLAILIVCFNFRVNVIPVLDATVIQKYVLMCLMVVVASATFLLNSGRSFASAFSICLLLQGASSIPYAQEVSSGNSIRHVASSPARKRDVYLLGFDAMVDERTFKKYFQSVTPWRQYLTGEGFRSIENVRSPGQTTLTTFHKILSMSETASKSTSFFTTDFEAFRHTSAKGYRTQFLFHNNHFGRGRSPHWDYNYPSTSVGVCPWVPANFGLYLCHRAIETSVEHWLGVEDGLSNYRQQLISRIRSAASDRNGWLTVAHTWLPGHTSMDYRHGDDEVRATFRAEYVSKSIEAVGYMTDFVRTIRALDRDAVIVMFGDHGAILSRSWENESGVRSLFTESEMLSDRRDVSLYVYPTDFCRGRIQNGYPMHNVIADVFSCIEDLDMSERPGVTGWSGTSGLSTLRPRAPTGH